MKTRTDSPARTSRAIRVGLWFGFLGGAAAWTAHLLLAYLIAEFGCEAGLDRHVYLGIMLPAWMLIGVSAAMILLSAAATFVAWRLRRRFGPSSEAAGGRDPDGWLARTGFQASALFTFVVIAQSLPVLYYMGSC